MKLVRALYDGRKILPLEPVAARNKTEVIVVFPDEENTAVAPVARKLLRGSGKGERLASELLKSRREDILLEERS
jgi:hypothetical protein